MNEVNKTVYFFVIVVISVLFLLSSVNMITYVNLIEEKYNLVNYRESVAVQNQALQKEIDELIEKQNVAALRFLLFKKEKNEKFVIIHEAEKSLERFVYEKKILLLSLYFIGGFVGLLLIFVDYLALCKKPAFVAVQTPRFYTSANQRT